MDKQLPMTQKFRILLISATAAILWLSVPSPLKAQVSTVAVISGKVVTEGGTVTNDTQNTPVQLPPVTSSITTATLLKQLAMDEKTAGVWPFTTFPAGARLIYVVGPPSWFQVVDNHNNLLLIVTNILSLENIGSNGFSYGYLVQSNLQSAALTYDTTAAGGKTKFVIYGFGTTTVKTSNPDRHGNYTETVMFSFQNGSGAGVNAKGVNIVVPRFTLTSNARLMLNNGSGDAGSMTIGVITTEVFPNPPPPVQVITND
jgi:hypothetical protein